MTKISVYANRHKYICLSACEHPPRNASSFRTLSHSSSPAADSTLRCHARHRGHTWHVSQANSSFSRLGSCKRRGKCATGHSLQHTLLTLAFIVLPAILSVLLGALREQQQLRGSYFARKLVIFDLVIFEGWEPQETHEKRAAGHSLLHSFIAFACMVRSATLNMQLGALRDSCSHANGHTVRHSLPGLHLITCCCSCCLKCLPLRATHTHTHTHTHTYKIPAV